MGKPRTASGRRRFDHVCQHSAARSSRRGTCPTGLAPRGLSGWIRITGGHALWRATRAASANVQHWPGSDSDESHLDARLGRQPHLWATPVFKWTSRRPGPVGATPAFGRPGNLTEFSDSDRRWPWARDPAAAGLGPETRNPGGSRTSTLVHSFQLPIGNEIPDPGSALRVLAGVQEGGGGKDSFPVNVRGAVLLPGNPAPPLPPPQP